MNGAQKPEKSAAENTPGKTYDNAAPAGDFTARASEDYYITMLCFDLNGKSEEKTIEVDAAVENIGAVTDFINEELENAGCSMKAQIQIDVMIDEVFGNIAKYAYGDAVGKAEVSIGIGDGPKRAVITFSDRGKQFDPLSAEEPDVTLSAEERKIGGLGLFIVKKTMDGVSYKYEDGKNILTVIKNI